MRCVRQAPTWRPMNCGAVDLGLWRPRRSAHCSEAITVYISVAMACSGGDFDSGDIWQCQETFLCHILGTTGSATNWGVVWRCVWESHRGRHSWQRLCAPDVCCGVLRVEQAVEHKGFAAVSSCCEKAISETPSLQEGEPPGVILWFCWGKAMCSEPHVGLFSSRRAGWRWLVYVTLCTNMSWLLFGAVKTMISF